MPHVLRHRFQFCPPPLRHVPQIRSVCGDPLFIIVSMKSARRRWIPALLLFGISFAELLLFPRIPSFFFPWYRDLSKRWMAAAAWLFSAVPYSVWDIGALCLVLLFILSLIRTVRRKHGVLRLMQNSLLVVSVLLFSAVQGWLGNHYAPKLSEYLSLDVRKYSEDELYAAAEYYLQEASKDALLIPRDDAGHALPQDFFQTAKAAGSSYLPLSETYPVFEGSSAPVKCFSLIGEYLLYNGIIGMFMPVTGESSVPRNVPVIPLPFTMCHEAAHRLGIASEQEANFCAFLACINQDSLYFRYSGYYSAFGYCWASLSAENPERAQELAAQYADDPSFAMVFRDRSDTRAAYAKYDSPLQDVSDNINDTYLKTFSHESGIRSYGEVTDYLIAWVLQPSR